MKRTFHYILSTLLLISAVILVGCAESDAEMPNESAGYLAASFIVTDWTQTHYEFEYTGSWWSSVVSIYYNAENTGDVPIDRYDVCFVITCADGSQYYHWTSRIDLGVGHTISKQTAATIPEKEVVSVKVVDWEIGHYKD